MSVQKRKRRRDASAAGGAGKAGGRGKRRGRHKVPREQRSRQQQQKRSPKASDAAEVSTTSSGREQSTARTAASRKQRSPAPFPPRTSWSRVPPGRAPCHQNPRRHHPVLKVWRACCEAPRAAAEVSSLDPPLAWPPAAQNLAEVAPTTGYAESQYPVTEPISGSRTAKRPAQRDAQPAKPLPADRTPDGNEVFVEMSLTDMKSAGRNDAVLPGIEALYSEEMKGDSPPRATAPVPYALAVRARDPADKGAPSEAVSSLQERQLERGSVQTESTILRRWRAALSAARVVVILPNRYRRRRQRQGAEGEGEGCKKDRPQAVTARCTKVASLCAVAVLVLGVILWLRTGEPKVRSLSLCTTQGCRLHELSLDRTVDPTVKPCDDFFAFACGNWKRASGSLPFDQNMHRLATAALHRALRSADSKGTAATFYASCMAEPTNVSVNVQQFLSWKKSLRLAWPDSRPAGEDPPHPLDVLLDLAISWNINVLFKVHVYLVTSGRRSAQTVLALSLGQVDAPWQETREERVRQNSYEDYLDDNLELLGAQPSVREGQSLHELFDTETRLLRVLRAGVSGTQSWFPLRQLQQASCKTTPSLRPPDLWLHLLNKHLARHVPLSPNDTIVAHSREMLGELDTLLSDYAHKAEKLLDAIAWVLVQTFLWAMAGSPRTVFRNDSTSDRDVLARAACRQLVDSRLGLLPAAPYVVKRYTQEIRTHLKEMFSMLATTAKEKIASLRWAGDGAKQEAVRKLSSVTYDVFPSTEFFDDAGRRSLYKSFTPRNEHSSFVTRFLEASAVLRGFLGTDAYERVYRRRIGEGGTPLSYYEYHTNVVRLSLDALERPMYTGDGTPAINFAGLGSYVARELVRSFDPVGSAVDSTGARRVWWGPSTSAEYGTRTSCLGNATRYGTTPADHRPADAFSMFPHVPALEVAFRAYKHASGSNKTADGLQLAFLGQLPGDQVFFLTYCRVLCATEEQDGGAAQACNVPLANLRAFASAFHCDVGSRMNPAAKCTFFDDEDDEDE
ncbi:hypothetical protein HPB50_014799 [Hyalomma asiaticum]|uniref:Uncharacterized protein n=1 Tax=Hyalomma asiaticum TaxID=266040 RepID=A0ACB7SEN9_HYAAI|nr:hypothetical protein HPB50_014799 [Hyalomma asiaticum]